MSSLIHNRFWGKRNDMGRRTLAKTSLVEKFSQVLMPANVIPLDKNNNEEEREIKALNQGGKAGLIMNAAITRRDSLSQRSKLEEDVERLEQRLQQELDLHAAFENAIAHAAGAFPEFPRHLPEHAQELLADIAVLEVAVSSLEEQMIALRVQIRYERDARHAAARWRHNQIINSPPSDYVNHRTFSDCEHISHPLQDQLKSNDRTSPAHHLYNQGFNVEVDDELLLDMVRLTTPASPECSLSRGHLPGFADCSSSAIGKNQIWASQHVDINDAINNAVEIEQMNANGSIDPEDSRYRPTHELGQATDPLVYPGPNFNCLLSSSTSSSPTSSYRTTASSHEGDSSTLTLESCSYSTQLATDISRHRHHHCSPAQWQFRSSYKSHDDENESIVKLHTNRTALGSRCEIRELWRKPNKLSEEMVSCMIGIYCHLADSSSSTAAVDSASATSELLYSATSSPFNYGRFPSSNSPSELSTAARSPSVDLRSCNGSAAGAGVMSTTAIGDVCYDIDPCINLRTKRVYVNGTGRYGSAVEVSWMSVGKEQLDYAADALRMFRSLVEQLSKVDVASLKHEEKLAFWINVYNALMMHAYLAYGVPRNDLKFFALMQKAAYTVGRHSFNAIAIEHVLLKGRPPAYRPQMALLLALHKLKIPAEAHKLAISHPEPLLTFALSCGAYSSPAVRIYRAESVHAQLEAALEDYALRAWVQDAGRRPDQTMVATPSSSSSIVMSVPKLLYLFARDVVCVDDGDLPSWLNRNFHVPPAPQHPPPPPHQQAQQDEQHECGGGHTFTVLPFDFRLRYLFLLDDPIVNGTGNSTLATLDSSKTRDAI